MSQTIDVTGLSPDAIRAVEVLVGILREKATPVGEPHSPTRPGPPEETPEQWVARFRAWCESHPKRDVLIDDDRESIYAGRGE